MKRLLLTGANRGLGRALAESLLRKGKHQLCLTTRDALKSSQLASDLASAGLSSFETAELEMSSEESIGRFARGVKQPFDVVYLNAGLNLGNLNKFDPLKAENTLKTNTLGNLSLIEQLLDKGLVNRGGKIIQVCSELGTMRMIRGEEQKKLLLEAKNFEDIRKICKTYVDALEKGEIWQSKMSHCPEYAFSKLLVTISAKVLADDPRVKERSIESLSVCPGWVRTDMGGPTATYSIEQAVPKLVGLIEMGPDAANQGRFYSHGKFSGITT